MHAWRVRADGGYFEHMLYSKALVRLHISGKSVLQGIVSGLSLETCMSNLKSIALTIFHFGGISI